MNSRKKGRLCLAVLLILFFSVTGCGKQKDSNVKAGNEIYSTTKETKEQSKKSEQQTVQEEPEEKTYAIYEIDTEQQTIRLQNTANGKISSYGYSDGTEFRDKYGKLTGIENMMQGRIVSIGRTNESGNLSRVQLSDKAWEQDNVTKFEIFQEQNMITVGNTKYYYDNSLLAFLDDEQIMLDDITNSDTLRVAGVDKKIVSLSVTSGHGFVELKNTDLFEGGWLSIGNRMFLKISKDMRVEVPQGTYKLSVAKDGYGDTKEVTVEKNKTLKVDLNEYQGSGPSYCYIQFRIKPDGAALTLNGEAIDYSQPLDLKYGVYRIGITAEGYDAFEEKLMVSSAQAVINIDLAEVAAEKAKQAEEQKSTGTTTSTTNTNSNTGSSTNNTSSSTSTSNTTGTTSSKNRSTSDSTKSTDSSSKKTTTESEKSTYQKVSDLLSTWLD